MQKEQIKSLVKKKIKTLSMDYSIGLRSKHSKSENLPHQNCMKRYLKSDKITPEEIIIRNEDESFKCQK